MKIVFTQHRELTDGKTVKPGDTLETSKAAPDELLQAYVNNGVAVIDGEALNAGKRESEKILTASTL